MSQRNPLNDRYTVERQGQTRKSAASAKPKSERAATVRDPAPKTRKQKRKEREERAAKQKTRAYTTEARYEDTAEYRHLRHIWWGFLIAAICLTGSSFLISANTETLLTFLPESVVSISSLVVMIAGYAFIILAFYLDLSRINRGRKAWKARVVNDNSKEARAKQKQARAEERERQRIEAAQAKERAANPPEEKKKGILGFFKRKKSAKETPEEETVQDTGSN